MEKNKKVGILTSFSEFVNSYSLCSVVESQLVALRKYGYDVVLFVLDNFKDDDKVPEGVEVRKIVPRFTLVDYADNHPTEKGFEEQVDTAVKTFTANFRDIDVMFTHDMLLQGWFLPYCVAVHKVAEVLDTKWFHWIHSVPNPMPQGLQEPHSLRYRLPKNSKLVYLNNYHLIRTAEAYGVFPKDVKVVYNPVDPRLFFDLDPLVSLLIDKYGLLESDFLQVYPVSTPRMVEGKGLYKLIDLQAEMKKLGKRFSVVVCNAHANADKEKETIRQTKEYASQRGINTNDLIFTSLEGEQYELGVDRKVISDLLRISNLFVFPSRSENCSLILLEAMLSKNLLVLNDSVRCMREFGAEDALYFKFSGIDEDITYDNYERWMNDVAKIIISEFSTNKGLKSANNAKKRFNYDRIFKEQIETILNEQI